jgi:hypothetical protein
MKIPDVFNEQRQALNMFTKVTPSPLEWESVLDPRLWGNDNIQIRNKGLYFPSLASKGVHRLSDLINSDTRSWISEQTISEKYALRSIDAHRLLGQLKKAVPIDWFTLPNAVDKEEISPPVLHYDGEEFKCHMRSHDWYSILIRRHAKMPRAIDAWNNTNYKPSDWNNVWKHLHLPFIPHRARDVAWRLIHRRLWVGHLLQKCRITNSNLCPLCKNEEETCVHLFINCLEIFEFWKFVETIAVKFDIHSLNLKAEMILFRDLKSIKRHLTSHKHGVLICLIMIGIWTVWKYRCAQVLNPDRSTHLISLTAIFRTLLMHCLQGELHRATKERSLEKFKDMWCGNNIVEVLPTNLIVLRL